MKFHIYKDAKKEWRWRLKAANGKIIADSGEGYTSKQGCRNALALIKGTTNIPVEEDPD